MRRRYTIPEEAWTAWTSKAGNLLMLPLGKDTIEIDLYDACCIPLERAEAYLDALTAAVKQARKGLRALAAEDGAARKKARPVKLRLAQAKRALSNLT